MCHRVLAFLDKKTYVCTRLDIKTRNDMRKVVCMCVTAVLLFSNCTSSEQASGVFAGGMLGGLFGSSIGGIIDGPRGHDAGSLLGMVVGGAVGAAATAPKSVTERRPSRRSYDYDTDAYNRHAPSDNMRKRADELSAEYANLSVENLRFIDANNNHAIDAGERCKLVFEIRNNGTHTLYNISPVISAEDNRRILISPSAIVESVSPGKGVRYTAEIIGKRNLKDGRMSFSLNFVKGNLVYTDRTFQLETRRGRR